MSIDHIDVYKTTRGIGRVNPQSLGSSVHNIMHRQHDSTKFPEKRHSLHRRLVQVEDVGYCPGEMAMKWLVVDRNNGQNQRMLTNVLNYKK